MAPVPQHSRPETNHNRFRNVPMDIAVVETHGATICSVALRVER